MALDGVLNTTNQAEAAYNATQSTPTRRVAVQPYSTVTVPGLSETGMLQRVLPERHMYPAVTPEPTVLTARSSTTLPTPTLQVPSVYKPTLSIPETNIPEVESVEGVTLEDVIPNVENVYTGYHTPLEYKAPTPEYSEFSKGVRRAIPSTLGMLAAGGAAAADAAGFDRLAGNLMYYNQLKQEEASVPELKAEVESYKDIDSIAKFGDYFFGMLGDQSINIAATIATAGAGAVAGGTGAGARVLAGALNGAVQKQTAALVAKGVAENEAKALAIKAIGATVGAQAGALAPEFALNLGENYAGNYESGGLMYSRPGLDTGAALLQSAVTLLGGESQLLRKLTGVKVPEVTEQAFKNKLLSSATSLPKAMIGEGAEEYLQEIIGAVNSAIQDNRSQLEPEDLEHALEAAVAGALVGGGIGGATVMVDMLKSPPKTSVQDPSADRTAIDLQTTYEDELSKIDPFTRVSKQEQMMRDAIAQEAQDAVAASQESFSKYRDPLITKLRETKQELLNAKSGTSPKMAMLTTQAMRDKHVSSLEKTQQRIVAQLARLGQAQREDIKKRKSGFEADLTASDKKARKAFRETVTSRFQQLGYDTNLTAEQIVDDRNFQQELFRKDPLKYQTILENLQDTSTYVSRALRTADKRMGVIHAHKAKLHQTLDMHLNGEVQLTPNMYNYVTSELARADYDLTTLARQQADLRKSASVFAKNTAKHSDLFAMQTEQDSIFAKADAIYPAKQYGMDIQNRLHKLSQDEMQTKIDKLVDYTHRLRKEAKITEDSSLDLEADFSDWTASQLGTTKAQQALPVGKTEAQLEVDRMRSALSYADAVRLNNEFNKDKQDVAAYLSQVAEVNAQRAYLSSPEYLARLKVQYDQQSANSALDGNIPERLAIPQRTGTARRDLEQEQLRRMYKQEQRAKQISRNVLTQRESFEFYTLQEKEVDAALANEVTKPVLNWMKNTLDSLPGLKDVIEVCSSVTDARVPTEINNALVNLSFKNNKSVPQAMYFDGKIYVFADRIKSKAQAVRVLMHEGVAHYGLRAVMSPKQFNTFMAGVFRDAYDTPIWKEFERKRSAYANANDLVRTEEFVAWLAETESPKSLLTRIPAINDLWQFITKLFRKLFGTDGFVTEADVRDVLAVSAQNLARKRKDNTGRYSVWGRAMYTTSTADNITPKYTHQELSNPDDFTAPYGWGTYFSSPNKLVSYFKRFNTRISGMPGQVYKNYAPSFEQFINWNESLSRQPYVVSHLNRLLKSIKPENVQTSNGMIVKYLGKEVGTFTDTGELANFTSKREYLDRVTGQDLYNFLCTQSEDAKAVSMLLRHYGIAGTTFTYNNTKSYCLFEGDASLQQEPNYADDGVRFMVESTSPIEDMPDLYLESWAKSQLQHQKWTDKVRAVKQNGKSVGLDGKLIHHNMYERLIEGLYDKHRRIYLVQDFIKNTAGPKAIKSATNIYRHLTGMINRINSKRVDIINRHVTPLAERVGKLDIPEVNNVLNKLTKQGRNVTETDRVNAQWAAVDEYLFARHALERNAEINKRYRGKNTLESPSGLTDTQAQAVLDKYSDVVGLEDIATEFDKLGRLHLDLLDQYKLVPKTTTDKLRATYKHYVPLKNWEQFIEDMDPDYPHKHAKAGISVGGRELLKKSKGREGLAESPSTQLILQLTDTVNIGEKNDVSRRLLNLVKEVPNADLWELATGRNEKGQPYFRLAEKGDGTLYYERKEHNLQGEGFKYINVIDTNGNRELVAIKDVALAAALRNENTIDTGPVINAIRKFTQIFASTLTTYNPVFAIKNYPRDIQTAILNVGNVISEAQANNLLGAENNIRQRILKDAKSLRMVKFLWSELKGKPYKGKDADYLKDMYKKYVEYGGHTRMFLANDYKTMYKDVRDLSKSKTGLRGKLASALKYLDSISDVSENATRFSVFVALNQEFDNHIVQEARKNNWTPAQVAEMMDTAHQRAANEALEITVNFTRKGSWAPLFNSLWAFSSANIGGNVRILRNLWRRGDSFAQNTKRTGAYMAYTVACGIPHAILCRWLMGDDDDGINKYDKIPDYIKNSNFIIPSPFGDGGYVKMPLPYGYNLMWVMSNCMDSVLHGRMKPSTAAVKLVSASFDNFNPTGGDSLVNLLPTIFRPIGEVAMNKNSFDYAIMPESTHSYKGVVPDSQKYWGTNPMWCRMVAETLNSWTFGSKVESGFIDISPETIQHITESYLGGLGRVATQALDIMVSPVSGAPVRLKDVPLANTFFGQVGYGETLNEFSKVRTKLQTKLNEIELTKKDTTLTAEEKRQVLNRNRDALALKGRFATLTAQMNTVRKEEKALDKTPKGTKYYEAKQRIEKRKEFLMKELTKAAKQQGFDYKE